MLKKLLIIGTLCKWEENEIKNAALSKGMKAKVYAAEFIRLQLNPTQTQIYYKNKNITREFKASYILFRRTRNKRDKVTALAFLALHLKTPFSDTFEGIIGNLTKIIFLPSLQMKHIKQVPTFFLEAGEKLDYSQIKFALPILVKPTDGRHGEGVEILKTASALKNFLARNNTAMMLQPLLPIQAEYRVFIIGSKSLGTVRKIPAPGKTVANYAAGARFILDHVPAKIEKEAIKICQDQGIEIGGVDLARAGNKFYLLEINRCPEFRAFTQATKINVARKIIDYLSAK